MPKNLKPKQRIAAYTLASGGTIEDARKAAKVNNTTVDRWLKQDYFSNYVNELSKELHDAKIRAYLESTESVGKQLRELSEILLEKSLQWANDIQLSEMSHGNAIKAIAETRALISDSHYLLDSALGIEKLRQTYLNEND